MVCKLLKVIIQLIFCLFFFSPCDKRRVKSRYLPAGATAATTTLAEFFTRKSIGVAVPWVRFLFPCFCRGPFWIRFLIACHQAINWWTVGGVTGFRLATFCDRLAGQSLRLPDKGAQIGKATAFFSPKL